MKHATRYLPARPVVALMIATVAALGGALPARAAFPGDNGRIAFIQPSPLGDIFTMSADGSDVRQLTDVQGDNFWPAWSANGRRIAFTSTRDGNYEIYTMDADGQNQTRLTTNPANDWTPTWSPDGGKIVFASDRGGRLDLWTMNADGTGDTNLTAGLIGGASDPAWSPDGRRIAFVGATDAGGAALAVMNTDGSGRTDLITYPPSSRSNFHAFERPSWSPDGRRISFGLIEGGGAVIFFESQLVNADGSGLTFIGNGTSNQTPAWSPDGRLIVFRGIDGLYTVRPEAPQDETKIFGTGGESRPDWQPITREPQRGDYPNASSFCGAAQDFLGDTAFRDRYGTNKSGANAFGKCVSSDH
jgi:Tol biopolymer transport system component